MTLTSVQIQERKLLKEVEYLNWLKYKEAVQTDDRDAEAALEKELGYSSAYFSSLKKRFLTAPSLLTK